MIIILFLIGMALSADGLYYGATLGMGLGEAIIVGIGILCILWSVFYDAIKNNKFLRFLRGAFVTCMTIFIIYSAAVCVFGHVDTATYNEDYIIVLGAGLKGNFPSRVLEERLLKAEEYMNRNGNAVAIVSGGQGKGEVTTEAQVMSDYLMFRGIGAERILPEENARNTFENFKNSAEVTQNANVVYVTNDFHVLRSLQMAKLNGMNVTHVGAPTPITLLPVSCARELVAQIATIRYYF